MATDASKKKGKVTRAKPEAVERHVAAPEAAVQSPQPAKRKATEDASPVAPKKVKSVSKPSRKKSSTGATEAVLAEHEVEEKAKPAKAPKKKAPSKKSKKEEVSPPMEQAVEEDDDSAEDEGDGTLALARTLGHDDDDEEEAAVATKSTFKAGQDVGVIPKVSTSKTKKSLKGASEDGPRVIYIGHIPFGFFEHEIRQYLSQFGPITNLRLSRNKKTGASKGYAFVEFADASTAAVVARTMDAYLLFGHILKVKLVPAESQHEHLFKGANKRFKKVPWSRIAARALERPRGELEWDAKVGRETRRRSARAEKLRAALGYEFEAPALKVAAEAVTVPPAVLETEGEGGPKAVEAPPPAKADEEKKAAHVAAEPAAAAPKAKAGKAKKSAKGKKSKP